MTFPTFTPPVSPSAGSSDKPEIKIRQTDFGDGYTQLTADGLNHIRKVLTLRFEFLEIDERDEIIAFLEGQKGVDPFYYTLPTHNAPLLFTCAEWETTGLGASLFTISATFRQNFRASP